MKKLNKRTLVIAIFALLLGGGAYFNYLRATAPMRAMSDLTLANLEAMAQEDWEWEMDEMPPAPDGMVAKKCYTAFGNNYGGDFYASCSQTSSNPQIMFPCGAVSSKEPAWGVTMEYTCYAPAYQM